MAKYHLKVPHAILFEEFFLSFVWHLIITGGNALPTDPDFTSGPLGILNRVATLIPIRDLNRIQVVRKIFMKTNFYAYCFNNPYLLSYTP